MRKVLSLLIGLLLITPKNATAILTAVGLDKNLYTSDFMIGNVVISVIFPESDGSLDSNIETWSEERKAQALSKIMSGLDWWTRQNPRSPLSFTFVSQTVATKYEPIIRSYSDEALWIPDIMGKLGFSGSRFTATRQYVNSLRNQRNADWGAVIFVVDSLVDTNGKFADGLFAYAYLGGPFMVMTYDNNGYGIANMDVVVAHEMGHVFHALDQYAGASSPNDYSRGYFPTINGNHAYSSQANEPNSIMRGGLRWGLDNWSRSMIGWKDADNNNKDDIFEQPPTVTLNSHVSENAVGAPGTPAFSGEASVNIVPRQGNAHGAGLTLDYVRRVEFRIENEVWTTAVATDGTFNSTREQFNILVPPSSTPGSRNISIQDVNVRVITLFSSLSGNGVSSSSNGSGTLDNAHAFPNPFKPNSELGHNNITFTGLTDGAKIKIFTVGGAPVTDLTTPSPASNVQWTGIDEDGEPVASGVYFYLITDSNGHKKEGKIAVVR